MPAARAWYWNNDMTVVLSGLQSSTMANGTYLNGSVHVTATIWAAPTTTFVANRLVLGANMGYVTGSAGMYRYTGQSTAFTKITPGMQGLAIITVSDSGLDGEWRVPFNGEYRGTS